MDLDSVNTWKDNFFIYRENLSIYYVISILISFLSVIVTWWYYKYNLRQPLQEEVINIHDPQIISDDMDLKKEQKEPTDSDEASPDKEIIDQLKLIKHPQTVAQLISAGLTEEQLKEEKEVESQQLAAIYKLLQEQQDKFNVSSIKELENQMKLYRP